MPDSCLAKRFGELIALTPHEVAALARSETREVRLRRGASLVRENDRISDLFILKHGAMMSYVLLADGSRQILRFLFPGDLIGVSALAYAAATETVAALGECEITVLDRALLGEAIAVHPRLGALMIALGQLDQVVATDRLAAVGRTSAKARVVALLLHLRDRQRRLDPALGASFVAGVTQEEIGDATGLTAVHVNRMLRQLEEEALITREGGRITLLDESRLARVSAYVNRFMGLDLGWLPPAR